MLVGFEQWPGEELADDRWANRTVDRTLPDLDVIRVNVQEPERFRESVEHRANVAYLEPDRHVRHHFVPDDPRYPDQDGPPQVELPGAWNVQRGDEAIRVAIVDTGIDDHHEDLSGAVVAERDFAEGDDRAQDDCGHGTHAAGIAAARIDNGLGIAGTANVSLIDAKALDQNDTACIGTISDAADAIRWAADQGADVVSMSFGLDGTSTTLGRAIAEATTKGALPVASAGNDGCSGCVSYPASDPDVVAVGCTTDTGERCDFSSQGPEVELAAPGERILSTWPGDSYNRRTGTSMSAPFVSGVAALAWSQEPNLTASEVRGHLQASAEDLGPDGRDPSFGYGEVDAEATLSSLGEGITDNEPPEASFDASCLSLTCTFVAHATDPDGDALTYEWNLGDGTHRLGPLAEHTYPSTEDARDPSGSTYRAELVVSDGQAETTAVQEVTVKLAIDLDVEPLEPTFGPRETPTVEVAPVRLDAEAIDRPGYVSDLDVRVSTHWSPDGTSSPLGLHNSPLLAGPLRSEGILYHETTSTTHGDEATLVEIPGEAGTGYSAPTPGHEVVAHVETSLAGQTYADQTTYKVQLTG